MANPELGKVCREARLKRKLTVRQLARILKLQMSSLSRFERGKQGMEETNVEKVLEYLKIEVVYLSAGEQTKKQVTCPRCLYRMAV